MSVEHEISRVTIHCNLTVSIRLHFNSIINFDVTRKLLYKSIPFLQQELSLQMYSSKL